MSHLDALENLAFETDREGVIQCVGKYNWEAFAKENDAPELTADKVEGLSLFDFVEGDDVKRELKRIMERISQDPNWSWVLPFRCDAPGCKRTVVQSIRPIFSDNQCTGFSFHSFEQSSELRPPIDLYDFKRMRKNALREDDLPVVMMCSWCQKVKAEDDTWMSAEDYYASGNKSDVVLSHGICEECLKTTTDPFQIN